MKVFISWSGDASRAIATKLYEWLPMVLQSVQPYMSAESIEKGTRWASSISNELEDTGVGIIVLTPENIKAPWIHFEAGALAKVVGDTRLAPLLCGLKPSDIGTPLSQFQVTLFNKEDILKLLRSINLCAGDDALPDARLEKMHGALWAELSSDVEPIIASALKPVAVARKPEDESSRILEEILVLTRQQSQVSQSAEKLITPSMIKTIIDIASESNSERDRPSMRRMANFLSSRWRVLEKKLSEPEVFLSDDAKSDIESLCSDLRMVIRDISASAGDKRSRYSREEEFLRMKEMDRARFGLGAHPSGSGMVDVAEE